MIVDDMLIVKTSLKVHISGPFLTLLVSTLNVKLRANLRSFTQNCVLRLLMASANSPHAVHRLLIQTLRTITVLIDY